MSEPLEDYIRRSAIFLGFDTCGFSKAEYLEDQAPRLEKWLMDGKHGSMKYMEDHFDKRLDPRKLMPDAKSIISLSYNYFTENKQPEGADYKVSKYAYGRDYHKVLKKRLKQLATKIKERVGDFEYKLCVDSAPIMDKVWAEKAGIGWMGKHTNLINKKRGSFFFIAEIVTDLELNEPSSSFDHCGTCTKCIDACPTEAITEPYVVDGNKCISYFTIELKENIPEEVKGNFDDWIFGCDVCQDVCPWNKFSTPHQERDFMPKEFIVNYNSRDWEELTEDTFEKVFEGSPIKRAKYSGIKRNIKFVRQS